jgi:DNA (cytosine-5)-methyltransferase 1
MSSGQANAELTEDIAPTLKENSVPRRITPLECERLQGFPDGWTEFYADGTQVADGPRHRMLGNAVTVNVAEWIGRQIINAEANHAQ